MNAANALAVSETKTVSSVLLNILRKHNIRHIFGLPSAQLGLVMNGASSDQWFRYITTRHEEAAGHMAHATHLVTGEMAVCFGTVGPGATNLLPGVAAAWADNIPMLVLTGNNQVNLIDPGRDLLQALDQISLYRGVTKWSATIRSAERAPELIERALYIARSGRPGPVHLDIPCDVGSWACRYADGPAPIDPPRPVPAATDVDRIARALREARRPLLLAGGGVARSEATERFRELARITGFPVATTPKAFGVAEFDGASLVGSAGFVSGPSVIRACQEADVILAIGCKFSTWTPINKPPKYPMPISQKIIQVDIDDSILGKAAPIWLGVVGDARETLAVIIEALGPTPRLSLDCGWSRELAAHQQAFRQTIDTIADERTTRGTNIANTAALMREVARIAPADAIFCIDGGQTMLWALTLLRPIDPAHVIFNAGMGHLGAGLPAANAAKMAQPDSTVILVSGDGATGCTVQELETTIRGGLKIVHIVFNDSHWGMYRPLGEMLFQNPRFGSKLTDVDFAAVARGFGWQAERVSRLEEFGDALRRALRASGSVLLDVDTDFTPHPMDQYLLDVIMDGVNLQAAL